MAPPYSRGDRVKCLVTMWDLSDSNEEGGSSAGDKPDTFSESHFARTGSVAEAQKVARVVVGDSWFASVRTPHALFLLYDVRFIGCWG